MVFKDLCLDANDTAKVARFWSMLLDLDAVELDDGDYRLDGGEPSRRVWVNGVPERKTVKSRVHLDVRLDGEVPTAQVLRDDDEIAWRVMADPDGLEWCAFTPREGTDTGPFELVVDCANPRVTAQWWADRTGAQMGTRDGDDFVWLEGAAGFPYTYWVFTPVPEPKTTKNRVHWDVTLADATVDQLVAAGATVLAELPRWTVLADPEGNEFCAFGR